MNGVQRGVRLQKALAACGLGSRRQIESWIAAGRLAVNGQVATLGMRVRPDDRITLDGRPIVRAIRAGAPQILLYHKPVGEVTTRRDPAGRPTVFDRLPPPRTGRWVVVGRLDVNTSGLLLFSNDGGLAHRLMHPSSGVEREYRVRVRGHVGEAAIARLRSGVMLADGPARFERVTPLGRSASHSWFRVVLREGRNREVRRLFAAVGHQVSRLQRLRYANIVLPADLPPGRCRAATVREAAALRKTLIRGGQR